ncbi:uncharacterized protein LOC126233971 [Schistocerca nitens]|uniref:uncharacterized protein LOC126233971 n=1 Tax=Schistocerca nitens TaxID=7011 RepID=UPI00211906AC|nr:uncharacterized protein LOC126233971 [Schistocerca nitens]
MMQQGMSASDGASAMSAATAAPDAAWASAVSAEALTRNVWVQAGFMGAHLATLVMGLASNIVLLRALHRGGSSLTAAGDVCAVGTATAHCILMCVLVVHVPALNHFYGVSSMGRDTCRLEDATFLFVAIVTSLTLCASSLQLLVESVGHSATDDAESLPYRCMLWFLQIGLWVVAALVTVLKMGAMEEGKGRGSCWSWRPQDEDGERVATPMLVAVLGGPLAVVYPCCLTVRARLEEQQQWSAAASPSSPESRPRPRPPLSPWPLRRCADPERVRRTAAALMALSSALLLSWLPHAALRLARPVLAAWPYASLAYAATQAAAARSACYNALLLAWLDARLRAEMAVVLDTQPRHHPTCCGGGRPEEPDRPLDDEMGAGGSIALCRLEHGREPPPPFSVVDIYSRPTAVSTL